VKPHACPFEPRCPKRFAPCHNVRPALIEVAPDHKAACYLNGPESLGETL